MVNNCGNCKHREVKGYEEPCSSCRTTSGGTPTKWEQQHTTQTNADRIRAMSDEELAKLIADTPICKEKWRKCWENGCDCEPCLLEWLKQPAEVTGDG